MADECGCSGIRSCLFCESKKEQEGLNHQQEGLNHQQESLKQLNKDTKENLISLSFCINCQQHFHGPSCDHNTTLTSENYKIDLSGVTVIENFISKDEELFIVSEIEKFPWRVSQSGRRKQDFGPKVNFKKKKVQLGKFSGLPSYSQFFVQRLQKVPQLTNFHPVELCNLDYCPERGASIDPHRDDSWLWGEHLVTLNLLSDTVLTLTDVDYVYEVDIPMPQYSLVILKGNARYKWMHGIKRNDIQSRRIAVTLRELSQGFVSEGGYEEITNSLLEMATLYKGSPSS